MLILIGLIPEVRDARTNPTLCALGLQEPLGRTPIVASNAALCRRRYATCSSRLNDLTERP